MTSSNSKKHIEFPSPSLLFWEHSVPPMLLPATAMRRPMF